MYCQNCGAKDGHHIGCPGEFVGPVQEQPLVSADGVSLETVFAAMQRAMQVFAKKTEKGEPGYYSGAAYAWGSALESLKNRKR